MGAHGACCRMARSSTRTNRGDCTGPLHGRPQGLHVTGIVMKTVRQTEVVACAACAHWHAGHRRVDMQRVRDARRGDGQVQLPASAAGSDAGSGLRFSNPRLQQRLHGQARPCAVKRKNALKGPCTVRNVTREGPCAVPRGSWRAAGAGCLGRRPCPVALICWSGSAVMRAQTQAAMQLLLLLFTCAHAKARLPGQSPLSTYQSVRELLAACAKAHPRQSLSPWT